MVNSFGKSDLGIVNTVLGPVSVAELGVVLVHEVLVSKIPGAEFAPEMDMDESKQFNTLKQSLKEYRRLGGGTIVDRSGMFRGRNVKLYRALSKETEVHIVASTGLGPASMVGSYFTTQQTEPPGPMPLDRLSEMFANEISQGTVIPRRERTGPAGLIATEANKKGITRFEEHLFRGSALAAQQTGATITFQYGREPEHELDILEKEGADISRIIVGGLDRLESDARGDTFKLARRGVMVALDHAGWTPHEGYVSDDRRVELILELFAEGLGNRVLISTNSVGYAIGHDTAHQGFDYLLSIFVPKLKKAGVTDEQVRQLLEVNPQRILSLEGDKGVYKPQVEGADITWVK
ncbi:phosphotriesterase [Oceanobacillus saliphilus]|uniref:phosphotriesterase family protein n=1 Tax=Oceanobacillus saliphilus TaxID=2925834 RepID=UPI00201E5B2B|nr:phosphotriesterase [Oceanobacillus saliphilus]